MLNRYLRKRFDLLRPNTSNAVQQKQVKQKVYAKSTSKTSQLFCNQCVSSITSLCLQGKSNLEVASALLSQDFMY